MADGVARLLKEILVFRHRNGIEQVADQLNETYDYVWSQTHERTNPSVNTIKAAFLVTKDPRLKRILTPAGFKLSPDKMTDRPVSGYEHEIGDLDIAVSTLRMKFREAMKDNMISKNEAIDISILIENIRLELIDVETVLKNYSKKPSLTSVRQVG